MDEGARLEIACAATYRGFESRPHRPFRVSPRRCAEEDPEQDQFLLSAAAPSGAGAMVMVGSRRLRIRESRQVRKEATVSVPGGLRGTRPSPPPYSTALETTAQAGRVPCRRSLS